MSEDKWITLKLTHLGENTSENVLREYLKKTFGSCVDIFFPFKSPKEDYSKKISVLDGYIFIKNADKVNYDPSCYHYYFESVNKGSSSISEELIKELKLKLKSLCEHHFFEGEYVQIIDGPYEELEGEIIRTNRESVVVQVNLRSRSLLIEVPKVCVKRYCP